MTLRKQHGNQWFLRGAALWCFVASSCVHRFNVLLVVVDLANMPVGRRPCSNLTVTQETHMRPVVAMKRPVSVNASRRWVAWPSACALRESALPVPQRAAVIAVTSATRVKQIIAASLIHFQQRTPSRARAAQQVTVGSSNPNPNPNLTLS